MSAGRCSSSSSIAPSEKSGDRRRPGRRRPDTLPNPRVALLLRADAIGSRLGAGRPRNPGRPRRALRRRHDEKRYRLATRRGRGNQAALERSAHDHFCVNCSGQALCVGKAGGRNPPLSRKPIPAVPPQAIRAAPAPFIALISWLFFGQTLDIPVLIGLVLTVAGVVVTTLFSRTISLCGRPLRRCPAAAVGRGGSTARSTTA